MPEAITHTTGTVVGSDIWFVGGYLGNHPGQGTTHVWRYDTIGNEWHRGPDLPVARGAGGSAAINGTLYFVGGMNQSRTTEQAEMWSLDLADGSADWVSRPSMSVGRNHVGVVAAGGKLYTVGGQFSQEASQVTQGVVEVYDPATNLWTRRADMPAARSHITAGIFELDGRVVVVGGESGFNKVQSSIYSYDPAYDSWATIGQLPAARSTVVAGVLADGRLISSTGNSPTFSDTTWIGVLR